MDPNFYKSYFEMEDKHWWFRVRRNIVFSLINEHRLPEQAKIFDFGCGSGYLVRCLQNLRYNASGQDVSAEAIEFGRGRGIKNLQVAHGPEIGLLEGSFDLALVLDVIEHIKDDYEAIRRLEEVLKPGGMAILTVPAYQWLWGVQDDVSHHFRRYNIGQLTNLIKNNSGLNIVRKTYFNTFLFPPIAGLRLISRLFKFKSRESDFDINNRLMNRVLYQIFNLESRVLNYINFPFGTSILIVVQKNE